MSAPGDEEGLRPHWIRTDGVLDLAAWREEVEARRSGGWGVWCCACRACAHRWVAVAPLSAGEHPFTCPACSAPAGVGLPREEWERGGPPPPARG